MARDGKRQLLFFGHPPSTIRDLQGEAPDHFAQKGLSINWQASYSVVSYGDIRAALDDGDQKRKSAEWIRDVRSSALRGILQSADRDDPDITGWGITLKPREFSRWRDAADQLTKDPTLRYNITNTSPNKRPPGREGHTTYSNAPFSYSPTDDYATEPDR